MGSRKNPYFWYSWNFRFSWILRFSGGLWNRNFKPSRLTEIRAVQPFQCAGVLAGFLPCLLGNCFDKRGHFACVFVTMSRILFGLETNACRKHTVPLFGLGFRFPFLFVLFPPSARGFPSLFAGRGKAAWAGPRKSHFLRFGKK